MKKAKLNAQEQDGKRRRLSLNRETIRFLDDPAFLGFAKGGGTYSQVETVCFTEPTSGRCLG